VLNSGIYYLLLGSDRLGTVTYLGCGRFETLKSIRDNCLSETFENKEIREKNVKEEGEA